MKHVPTRKSPKLSPEFKAAKIQELLDQWVSVRMRGVLYKDGDALRERPLPDALMRTGSHYRELDRGRVVPLGTLHTWCNELNDEEFHRVTNGWWRT